MPIQTLDFVCTPASLLASSPCLECLSEKQMLAGLLGIFAIANEQAIPDVLKESDCFMCMSKKQMLQALVTIAGNQLLGEGTSGQTVIDKTKCLQCASEKQLLAAILWQLCNGITISSPVPE